MIMLKSTLITNLTVSNIQICITIVKNCWPNYLSKIVKFDSWYTCVTYKLDWIGSL
jgi:hypothetical protein